MNWLGTARILLLVAAVAALLLRLPRLDRRPMHGDEAVHAAKLGTLLEKGEYRYDEKEFHGPTLYYLTLIPAWISGRPSHSDLTENTLRIVPAFFGIILVLLPLAMADGLGRTAAAVAAFLIAISPSMVFFSRYYIHETLLVCFTFGAVASGFRYSQGKKPVWAILSGVFLGLTHATKETSLIVFISLALALWLAMVLGRKEMGSKGIVGVFKDAKPWHLCAGMVSGGLVSILFYSSFLANPGGILDSLRAYGTYLGRGVDNPQHIHPWYYYLKILLYSHYDTGPIWSEGFVVILAIPGMVVALSRKTFSGINMNLARYFVMFSLVMTVLYSAIPYKTPWNMLGLYYGMILLAGVGTEVILRSRRRVRSLVVVIAVLIAGSTHLVWQTYLANYRCYSSPSNPYVYAHPGEDVFTIREQVSKVAEIHPDGNGIYMQVIFPNNDYWPLPWYFRSFPNVGWWSEVNKEVPSAPLIVASPTVEKDLLKKLYDLPVPGKRHLYVPLFDRYVELRPGVELRGYVRKDLWDRIQQ